ncbi:MAG: class IV adenylate cyclase [Vicinamibacterales bacterium]
MAIEHEIKLAFSSVEAARQAVTAAGGRLDVSRRLLDDRLFDTVDQHLGRGGSALRVRRDGDRAFITFKGPVEGGPVKSRPEIETAVGDAGVAEAILVSLGFRRWFRGEKYREEYLIGKARVTVDEAPVGVFVEIEAPPDLIDDVAARLGRGRHDYRLESYPALQAAWCRARGRDLEDMVFSA